MTNPNRWAMLVVGMTAQSAGTIAGNAAVFLIPYLLTERNLSLSQAGLLASASLLGTALALIPWGFVVDKSGERFTLTVGLATTTAGTMLAAFAPGYPLLAAAWFVAGAGLGSSNAASGRLVVGWFPPERRGVAMGIRQTAVPLGLGLAAVCIPQLASSIGMRSTLLLVAGLCAAVSVICWTTVSDPPRPPRAEASPGDLLNPYRRDSAVARVSTAAVLLVVPQFMVWTFMLVWLVEARGWSMAAAGSLVAISQLLGAAGRVAAGWWSDRTGGRLGPMRVIAVAAATVMVLLGLAEPTVAAVAVIMVASVITVADNGLAFTSVAELSGPFWSGRALGVHNAGQYLMSALVPSIGGAVITAFDYSWAFAAAAAFALLAVPVIPNDHRTPM